MVEIRFEVSRNKFWLRNKNVEAASCLFHYNGDCMYNDAKCTIHKGWGCFPQGIFRFYTAGARLS